jgi:hypothetical protein
VSSEFLDDSYECFLCHQPLRWSPKLGVVEVDAKNPDHVLNNDHRCPSTITKTKRKKSTDDIGISSMRSERQAQEEYYGEFHSASQLSPNTTQTVKSIREKQRQPRTEEHSKNISTALTTRYHDRLETRRNSIIRLLQSGITNKAEIAERIGSNYFVVVQDILQLKAKGII